MDDARLNAALAQQRQGVARGAATGVVVEGGLHTGVGVVGDRPLSGGCCARLGVEKLHQIACGADFAVPGVAPGVFHAAARAAGDFWGDVHIQVVAINAQRFCQAVVPMHGHGQGLGAAAQCPCGVGQFFVHRAGSGT